MLKNYRATVYVNALARRLASGEIALPTYDTITLPNATGTDDIFVCRYTEAGRLNWAARMTGAGADNGNGVSADSNGNVYVAGYYASALTIYNSDGTPSAYTLANSGGLDAYVVKYNSFGFAQWAVRMSGSGAGDVVNAVTVDNSGVYVTGQYTSNPLNIYSSGGATPSFTLANSGSSDVFVVKYDTSGIAQWATRLAGAGAEEGYGISLDSSGGIYVTGYYYSNPLTIYDFNGTSFGTLANSGSGDVFIVKYNTSGIAQWATRIAGTAEDVGVGISVDSIGNVYVTGYYGATPTIYNAGGASSGITLANSGATDVFIVKYNTSGITQWGARVAGTGSDQGLGISLDSTGVYLTGNYSSTPLTLYNAGASSSGITLTNSGSSDVFVVKYDTSGIAQWATRVAGTLGDTGYGISVGSGGVYATGWYASSPLTIYNAGGATLAYTLPNSGNLDIFVVKYNTSGIAQWATRLSGTGNEYGFDISAIGSVVYVSGRYDSNPLTLRSVGF